MAYEVFQRTGFRVDEPMLSINPDGRIVPNAAAMRILSEAGIKSALLLWDKAYKKMAIKAVSKGDRNAYAVSFDSRKYSGSLRAKSFLGYIGWSASGRVMLPATWNAKEKMLEITLPPEFLGSKR